MKESKVHTFVGRRLKKAKIVKDLIPEDDVVDISQNASENEP